MKGTILSLILLLSILFGCTKNTDSTSSQGNYVKLDNDNRSLGAIPSGDIDYTSAPWSSPDEWEFVVDIENKCNNIKGLKNNLLRLYFYIWDKNLTKSEYDIDITHNPGTASIRMDIQDDNSLDLVFGPYELGKKLYITKDELGKLKSVKFSDLTMSDGSYTFKASTHLTIGN